MPSRRIDLFPARLTTHQAGIAIGLILTAVALVSLLGIVLTLGGKAGAMISDNGHATADATMIIEQAANLKMANEISVMKNNVDLANVELNTNQVDYTHSSVGSYESVEGGTEPQIPPADAFTGSPGSWTEITYNITGVGTGGGSYMFGLDGLTQAVCAAIDKHLTGSYTIPAVSIAISASTDYNLRTQTSLNGEYELCFADSNNAYHYYKTVRAN